MLWFTANKQSYNHQPDNRHAGLNLERAFYTFTDQAVLCYNLGVS